MPTARPPSDLPPPSPSPTRTSPHSPPTTRARPSRNNTDNPTSSTTTGGRDRSDRDRDRDRPPHHVGPAGADKRDGSGAGAAASSGGMGAFRHASARGEKRGERGTLRDEVEEKGGLRKVGRLRLAQLSVRLRRRFAPSADLAFPRPVLTQMAESFDRGERLPKSWGARTTDAASSAAKDGSGADGADEGRPASGGRERENTRDRDDGNWGKGDWRSRGAFSGPSLCCLR